MLEGSRGWQKSRHRGEVTAFHLRDPSPKRKGHTAMLAAAG